MYMWIIFAVISFSVGFLAFREEINEKCRITGIFLVPTLSFSFVTLFIISIISVIVLVSSVKKIDREVKMPVVSVEGKYISFTSGKSNVIYKDENGELKNFNASTIKETDQDYPFIIRYYYTRRNNWSIFIEDNPIEMVLFIPISLLNKPTAEKVEN